MTEEQIIKNLKKLHHTVSLTQEEKEQGRVLFLQKVDQYHTNKEQVTKDTKVTSGLFGTFSQKTLVLKESLFNTRQSAVRVINFYSSHIVASVVMTVLVFGFIGAFSALEARKASPDNKPFYTLKVALEKTQLNLSFSASSKTKVRANSLARRGAELDHLVAKTIANPEYDGVAVVASIQDTQKEMMAVREDLVSAARQEDSESIAELTELVGDNIQIYKIALTEAHDELPETIQQEIESDIAAVVDAMSEISLVIEQIENNEFVKGDSDINLSDLSSSTDDILLNNSFSSTTAVTTTDVLIDSATTVIPVIIPIIEEEPFTTEGDTFEVRIGN